MGLTTPRLEINAGAAFASIQDAGRFGYQALGLGSSGVMDPRLLMLGNGLLGQDLGLSGLEFAHSKLVFTCHDAPFCFVLAAHAQAQVDDKLYGGFSVICVFPGQQVSLFAPKTHNYGFVAFMGGLSAPRIGGSCARHGRADIGLALYDGQSLSLGEKVNGVDAQALPKRFLAQPPQLHAIAPLSLCAGPQEQMFCAQALEDIVSQSYEVTAQADRMGIRLRGKALAHKERADIASEPIALGAMQVPSDGQPIVMLAERQTTGGYAKIATLTSLASAQLAQTPALQQVRFERITPQQARAQSKAVRQQLLRLLEAAPVMGNLYASNLISGAYSAED